MITATVLYDGNCQFCNRWICFVKGRLSKNQISFLPFDSNNAITILRDYKITNQDSVVYIKNNLVFLKSRAVLKICKQLKFPYNLANSLTILPTYLLDFCYNHVAKRRFNFHSNKQCCNG